MKREIKKEILGSTSRSALDEMLERERERLRVFRFRTGQGKAKNMKEGRELRKAIARILTRRGQLSAALSAASGDAQRPATH